MIKVKLLKIRKQVKKFIILKIVNQISIKQNVWIENYKIKDKYM